MSSDEDIQDDADYEDIQDDADYEDIQDDADYSDDEALYADGDEEEFLVKHEEREKNCTVISPDVMRQLQEEDISSVSNVLAVSRAQAIILLLHFKWVVSTVQEKWCIEQEKVREAVGLFEKPIVDFKKNIKKHKLACGICFESYRRDKMHDAAAGGCGHLFCESCWRGYIDSSVNDGPKCLMLQCPDPSCNAAVGQDMVNAFVCEESKQKYSSYLLRSYIEDSKDIKWCPKPYCGSAIKFEAGSESCDVTCDCYYSFCWDCNAEAHTPVSCRTVEKWNLKNNDEAENVRWILVHSKPCPKCRRPIERDKGCNHMQCSICQFQFCWFCLASINKDDPDVHLCNRNKEKKEGANEANENLMTERGTTRNWEKYTHYYERWAANSESLNQAIACMKSMNTPAKTDEICFILCMDNKEDADQLIRVIKDAWLQIVECRRILKWSYAYGFYLPEHEYEKINLFDCVQGQAELGLERLHQFAEKLQTCLDSDHPLGDFKTFVQSLDKQTTDTRNFFKELVSAFKNDLSEVDSQGADSNIKKALNLYEIQTKMGYTPYDQMYTSPYAAGSDDSRRYTPHDQRHTSYDQRYTSPFAGSDYSRRHTSYDQRYTSPLFAGSDDSRRHTSYDQRYTSPLFAGSDDSRRHTSYDQRYTSPYAGSDDSRRHTPSYDQRHTSYGQRYTSPYTESSSRSYTPSSDQYMPKSNDYHGYTPSDRYKPESSDRY